MQEGTWPERSTGRVTRFSLIHQANLQARSDTVANPKVGPNVGVHAAR